MKKLLSMMLVVCLSLTMLIGCAKEESKETGGETKTAVEEGKETNEEQENTAAKDEEASDKQEKTTEEKTNNQSSMAGDWVTLDDGEKGEIILGEDGTFTMKELSSEISGTYTVENGKLELVAGDGETSSAYVKQNDNHLVISNSQDFKSDFNAAYFVRAEDQDQYDLLSQFSPRNRVWTVQSGVETIRLDGEEFAADELYFRFLDKNILQVSKPEKMGDARYAGLFHSFFEFSDHYETIEFIFNDPFTGDEDTSYEVQTGDDQLILKGSQVEVVLVPVSVS